MGSAEVQLFKMWAERLADAEDPLALWYEDIWAEDIDHRAIEGAPDDIGPIIGRDAMRAYLQDWYEMFPDLETAPEEIIELRASVVYTVSDGRIVRGRECLTKDEALAAVGKLLP